MVVIAGVAMVITANASTVYPWSHGTRRCRRGGTLPSNTSPSTATSGSLSVE